MAVVVLTFTSSDQEITSGIPQTVTITSNIPSVIYYTIDETTPTDDSPIYITAIEFPDDQTSVTLSAFGVDGDGYEGSILTQVFAADMTSIDRTRHIGLEGITVDRYDDPTDIVLGYDADGDDVAYTDIYRIDLDTIYSSEGRLGIAEGNQIEVLTPDPEDTAYPYDDQFMAESRTSDDFFNPHAKTIIIDNRRDDNVIDIIGRPFGSIRHVEREYYGGHGILGGTDSTYISGGLVKSFYNPKDNLLVSYYMDRNTNRWVKSLQELDSNDIPKTVGNFNQSGQPLSFQWLPWGRHSSIPI